MNNKIVVKYDSKILLKILKVHKVKKLTANYLLIPKMPIYYNYMSRIILKTHISMPIRLLPG